MTSDRCDLLCLDAPRAEAIRQKLLNQDAAQDAAERAKALSDPTRLMLGRLCARAESFASVTWLGSPSAPRTLSHTT